MRFTSILLVILVLPLTGRVVEAVEINVPADGSHFRIADPFTPKDNPKAAAILLRIAEGEQTATVEIARDIQSELIFAPTLSFLSDKVTLTLNVENANLKGNIQDATGVSLTPLRFEYNQKGGELEGDIYFTKNGDDTPDYISFSRKAKIKGNIGINYGVISFEDSSFTGTIIGSVMRFLDSANKPTKVKIILRGIDWHGGDYPITKGAANPLLEVASGVNRLGGKELFADVVVRSDAVLELLGITKISGDLRLEANSIFRYHQQVEIAGKFYVIKGAVLELFVAGRLTKRVVATRSFTLANTLLNDPLLLETGEEVPVFEARAVNPIPDADEETGNPPSGSENTEGDNTPSDGDGSAGDGDTGEGGGESVGDGNTGEGEGESVGDGNTDGNTGGRNTEGEGGSGNTDGNTGEGGGGSVGDGDTGEGEGEGTGDGNGGGSSPSDMGSEDTEGDNTPSGGEATEGDNTGEGEGEGAGDGNGGGSNAEGEGGSGNTGGSNTEGSDLEDPPTEEPVVITDPTEDVAYEDPLTELLSSDSLVRNVATNFTHLSPITMENRLFTYKAALSQRQSDLNLFYAEEGADAVGFRLWVKYLFSVGKGKAGRKGKNSGFVLGGDMLGDSYTIGFAVGKMVSKDKLSTYESIRANGYSFSLYGSYKPYGDRVVAESIVSYTTQSNKIHRVFEGINSGGKFKSQIINFQNTIGIHFDTKLLKFVSLVTPYMGVEDSIITRTAYEEKVTLPEVGVDETIAVPQWGAKIHSSILGAKLYGQTESLELHLDFRWLRSFSHYQTGFFYVTSGGANFVPAPRRDNNSFRADLTVKGEGFSPKDSFEVGVFGYKNQTYRQLGYSLVYRFGF